MKKINTVTELRRVYKQPHKAALQKVMNELDKHSIHFISLSPFCIISTSNNNGNLDASPKGGDPGFAKIKDSRTILFPDWPGNNRLDSFTNVIENPNISLIFFVPGINESLRVIGTTYISNDSTLLKVFKIKENLPLSVLVISVSEVYFHCSRALMRSKLWTTENKILRSDFPTMGKILQDQITGYDGDSADKLIEENKYKLYEDI